MLWKTHIRICKEVLNELRLNTSAIEASRLRDGVVEPDKWEDWPHHFGKSDEIRKYLLESRRLFLHNNLPDAYYSLGIALHYIQDAYTSVKHYDSPNNRIYHQNYEQDIEDAPFISDIEREIQYRFRNDYSEMNRYSALVRDLSRNIDGKDAALRVSTLVGDKRSENCGKPIIDKNMALKASYVVSKSVLGPKNCPELEAALTGKLMEYERLCRIASYHFP